MIPPCLTLSIITYVSRVKWSNLGEGVAPSRTPLCSSYRKGSLQIILDYGRQLYFYHSVANWMVNCFILHKHFKCIALINLAILYFFNWVIFIYKHFRNLAYCNGYHPRKWAQEYEFKSWTRMLAFHLTRRLL